MTTKVFSFLAKVFTFLTFVFLVWSFLFMISGIVFDSAFNMHPSNPEYESILHVWHILCYAMFFPSALAGAYLVRKCWWD